MLSEAQVQALVQARHADPFALLGLHTGADGALWMRALLPRAAAVTLHERGDGAVKGRKVATLEQRHADGLWEAKVPRRKKRFDYRLHVRWDDGNEGRYADAYAFGTLIDDADLHYFGEGSHLRPFTSARCAPDLRWATSTACASRSGHRMRAASAWSATSTPGTAAAT